MTMRIWRFYHDSLGLRVQQLIEKKVLMMKLATKNIRATSHRRRLDAKLSITQAVENWLNAVDDTNFWRWRWNQDRSIPGALPMFVDVRGANGAVGVDA